MATSDTSPAAGTRLKRLWRLVRGGYNIVAGTLHHYMPKGLYGRALIIIVAPMVLLQSVLAFVFMERHWETVTNRLSDATVRDIAALISIAERYPQDNNYEKLSEIARDDLQIIMVMMPPGPLPPPAPKPFFSLLDRALARKISRQIGKPFWIDTVGRSDLVEIRIQLDHSIMRIFAKRSHTYASNSYIFVIWMVSTSLVLIIIAILFLRNQIRPIQQLANAAESLGRGHEVADLRPRGSREVRLATEAFLKMRDRIARHIEQRTVMLAGVSHDLRTVLTRFRLELELIGEGPEIDALKHDVDEMQAMLETYLTFVRGDGDETVTPTDLAAIVEDLEIEAEALGATVTSRIELTRDVAVKPNAFKRMLLNLVTNAAGHADHVEIAARDAGNAVVLVVDDNGPGIPEEELETVFRPFYRLDTARNQDRHGTGLGLAIVRDIARAHGGEIGLSRSPLGGLRATIRIPI